VSERLGERDSAAVPAQETRRTPRTAASEPSVAATVVALQRAVGNAAVAGLLQRAGTVAEPTTPTTARKKVRYGSRGDDVYRLQSRLNRSTDVTEHLAVDGIFGPRTLAAVREFQAAHPPLEVDGVVGPLTWPVVEAVPDEPADDMPIAKKLFHRGAKSYEQGDFAHAYDFFTRAGEREDRAGLIFSRAQALRRLGGRREEAIALYEQYLATPDPTRKADAEANLAELRGAAKTGEEELDNANAKAAFTKGAGLYEQGDFAHAYDEFTKAYELAPRAGLIFSRAQALRRLGGRREEAITLYEQYLATKDGTRKADAESLLAELRGPAKTGEEELDNANAKAAFTKGAAHYEAGRFAHAYDEFTKAYELSPRAGLLFSRAQALRKLGGRRDEAIALYEQYLASADGTRKADAEFWRGELKHSGAAP
jgi:peptidoglycan hydrolase-like protein with peptidoglycan-binding domain